MTAGDANHYSKQKSARSATCAPTDSRVAIATASEKFIDRFAVVLDEDCFATDLDAMFLAGRETGC